MGGVTIPCRFLQKALLKQPPPPSFLNVFPSDITHKHKVKRGSIRFLCNLVPVRKALLGVVPVTFPLVTLRQIIPRIDTDVSAEKLLDVPIDHELVERHIIIDGVAILKMVMYFLCHDFRCLRFRHLFFRSALLGCTFFQTVISKSTLLTLAKVLAVIQDKPPYDSRLALPCHVEKIPHLCLQGGLESIRVFNRNRNIEADYIHCVPTSRLQPPAPM